MRISVIIPTYRRPAYLRSALESIANQSRLGAIAEIIVSENSDDAESLAVVRSFPGLPIRHIFQTPPIEPGLHFCRLVDEAKTEWVACLGDDDMWGRYHVEDAERALTAHPEAVAYCSQHVYTGSEARRALWGSPHLLTEHMNGRSTRLHEYWVFDKLQMAVESLLLTPLNMWAIVSRRESLAQAFTAMCESTGGYDSDRYMFWLLARTGPIVVGREIGLFYRYHDRNATHDLLRENLDFHMRTAGDYTRRIIRAAEQENLGLKEAWLAAMRATPPERRREYWKAAIPGARRALIEAWGDDLRDVLPTESAESPLKRFARDLLPPLVWRMAAAWKHRTPSDARGGA